MKKAAITALQIILFTAFFASWHMIHPQKGFACSCAGPNSVQEELQKKAAVFSGKAVSVKTSGGLLRSSADPVEVKIEVDKVWKGELGKTQLVYTARDGASCGFGFEKGKQYLVYAYSDNDRLVTNMCDRTKLISNAAEDLSLLKEGKLPSLENRQADPDFTGWYILIGAILLGVASYIVFTGSKRRRR
ncbi:hypothetical protein [Paenibacillus contaminans]|uniref:Tissue inhibitor of metalloproteinase n=1 Tax=Paenibacillus contaminans TaxID=450362 RepID=A0A329M7M0_9BACL|nr:hypothetical protein [Paenibacillus contaminans]RAV12987.1 hypothetical protein DQG23_33945 [Paenibacillus contaminans]